MTAPGAFRDRLNICGWCTESVEPGVSTISMMENGGVTFHAACFNKMLTSMESHRQKHQAAKLKKDHMRCAECGDWKHRFASGLKSTVESVGIWLIILCVVGAILAMISVAFFASEETNYCFLEATSSDSAQQVELWGQVDWRSDRKIGTFGSIAQAKEAAQLINCPLK